MEDIERFWGDNNMLWGVGPFAGSPGSVGYGFTYPGMMPFWGFGLEPNLWADANIQNDMEDDVMRNYMNMNQISNKVMPIDMLYPKCFKMMYKPVNRECNIFIKKNSGIMPNKIGREEFCKMVENCTMHIINNEDTFVEKLKETWMCKRDEEDEEIEIRSHFGRHGNLLIGGIMSILLLQELRRRGCMYCY